MHIFFRIKRYACIALNSRLGGQPICRNEKMCLKCLTFWNSLYHLTKVEIHIKHTYLYEQYAYKEDMQCGAMQNKCMKKNTKSWNAKMNLK